MERLMRYARHYKRVFVYRVNSDSAFKEENSFSFSSITKQTLQHLTEFGQLSVTQDANNTHLVRCYKLQLIIILDTLEWRMLHQSHFILY